ncbi:PREDICTED: adenylate kinase 9-like [Priapulus caudatus]|uniref:Adenylate kinase 9-like n=1 Tax=Priapulus caudatus TaxID=37621 RepID=A0ABM1DT50_PRICU|nr:PREDICTED: adenylate kinase 9-like [Priapulus caudatus]
MSYNEDQVELEFLKSKPACFVVWGKPCVGKTTLATWLCKDWNCILINCTELLEEAIKKSTDKGKELKKLLTSGDMTTDSVVFDLLNEKIKSPEVRHYGYTLDSFPVVGTKYMSVEKQLDMIWSWDLKPDVIINLRIPDRDLEKRRSDQRVDFLTNNLYTRSMYLPDVIKTEKIETEKEDEEEAMEENVELEVVEVLDETIVSPDVVRRLVKRPEDVNDVLTADIQLFRAHQLIQLENYIEKHDQQYVIELDANHAVDDVYMNMLERLAVLPIQRAIAPKRLMAVDDDSLEGAELDEIMRALAGKNMVAPKWRWRRSKWQNLCPVALYEGNMVEGRPQFAVSFLDKMYMLSSKEAVERFTENPRYYLLPPNPRIPCKICVLGPPLSGKSTLCEKLAQHYDAVVICAKEHESQYLEEKKIEIINQAKRHAAEITITSIVDKMAEEAYAGGADDKTGGSSTVDETHPDVAAAMEAAAAEASKQEVTLTPELHVEMLQRLIVAAEKKSASEREDGKRQGGFILDGWPSSHDQWVVMVDRGMLVDDMIVLTDAGQGLPTLLRRWHETTAGKTAEGTETENFKMRAQEEQAKLENIVSLVTGNTSLETKTVDITNNSVEEILREVISKIEGRFKYQAWEYSPLDQEEDDEDIGQLMEEYFEQAENGVTQLEDPETYKSRLIALGDTNRYCPVALTEKNVLYPGNPELSAKFREKTYFFSTEDAKGKFLLSPSAFMPDSDPPKPPPLRLFMLGPRGAGKTTIGRLLAQKLGVFHIKFREKLQELIIHKTQHPVVPAEFEEDKEFESEDGKEDVEAAEDEEQDPKKKYGFTEEEENIFSFLKDGEALAPETLARILPDLWQKEPYMSHGFILEDFPRTPEDTHFLASSGFFPDAAILLNLEDSAVISRLLPERLNKWKARRDARHQRKREAKENMDRERTIQMNARRMELEAERAEAAVKTGDSGSAGEEDEDEAGTSKPSIDDILQEEFPEPEADAGDDDETETEARERMQGELGHTYESDVGRIESVKETLAEFLIPCMEVEASRRPSIVQCVLERQTKYMVDFRDSIFERVYPVTHQVANALLGTGHKVLSKFGKFCPVKLQEGDVFPPQPSVYPAVYRQHVYWLSTQRARDRFISHPFGFLNCTPPAHMVPIHMAVVGPPKSGKTNVARKFAEEYGLVRVSVGDAMRHVLEVLPKSDLAINLREHLCQGLTAPDELAVQALEVMLTGSRCQSHGWILDGYPLTHQQIGLLTERSIIPVKVLALMVEPREAMARGAKDRNSANRMLPLHDSAKILAMRIVESQKQLSSVQSWYQEEHNNWEAIDGERSKWWVWRHAVELAQSSVKQLEDYLHLTGKGCSASISGMCIRPKEFKQKLGEFQYYCPVSLAEDGQLIDCSANDGLRFAAEYKGRYYKMASAEKLQQFLADPERFVPPSTSRTLPPAHLLPQRKSLVDVKQMFPKQADLQGFCPVTYIDGNLKYEALVPGSQDLAVTYDDKLFLFTSEQCLEKFLRLPERYSSAVLPHKLPPLKQPLVVTGLPMLGYLEQCVSHAIIKALTAVGTFKPKFPFQDPTVSALIYVAYHLKAFNPKNSDYVKQKYRHLLQKYEDQCNLIGYLGQHMTIQYQCPREREIEFDYKMENFLMLKDRLHVQRVVE